MAAKTSEADKRPQIRRRMRGFESASGLLGGRIQRASEGRGFAVTRLLTHWTEIVGQDLAALCQPVRVKYGKGAMGATLTLLASGAAAPLVQMQLPRLREAVNACYGYNAIARITVTQSAPEAPHPTGFAEAQTPFDARKVVPETGRVAPQLARHAAEAATGVKDETLRKALAELACNVLARTTPQRGT